MIYRKNLGRAEGWLRVMVGASMAIGSAALVGMTPLGWALCASGAVVALTGLVGYCPACAIAGRQPLDGPR